MSTADKIAEARALIEPLADSLGRRNNRKLRDKACKHCGSSFRPHRLESVYCSRPCQWANNGGQNRKDECWWVNSKGYVEGRVWEDGRQIRVKQHRHKMEKHLGRKIGPDEDVHHIDGNKLNNEIENLVVIGKSEHAVFHNSIRREKRHDH